MMNRPLIVRFEDTEVAETMHAAMSRASVDARRMSLRQESIAQQVGAIWGEGAPPPFPGTTVERTEQAAALLCLGWQGAGAESEAVTGGEDGAAQAERVEVSYWPDAERARGAEEGAGGRSPDSAVPYLFAVHQGGGARLYHATMLRLPTAVEIYSKSKSARVDVNVGNEEGVVDSGTGELLKLHNVERMLVVHRSREDLGEPRACENLAAMTAEEEGVFWHGVTSVMQDAQRRDFDRRSAKVHREEAQISLLDAGAAADILGTYHTVYMQGQGGGRAETTSGVSSGGAVQTRASKKRGVSFVYEERGDCVSDEGRVLDEVEPWMAYAAEASGGVLRLRRGRDQYRRSVAEAMESAMRVMQEKERERLASEALERRTKREFFLALEQQIEKALLPKPRAVGV